MPSHPICISNLVQAIRTIARCLVEEHVTHLVQDRSREVHPTLVTCADVDDENSPDGVEARETPTPESWSPLDHNGDSSACSSQCFFEKDLIEEVVCIAEVFAVEFAEKTAVVGELCQPHQKFAAICLGELADMCSMCTSKSVRLSLSDMTGHAGRARCGRL